MIFKYVYFNGHFPKGFNILELLIVLTIVGILAALLIPNFLNLMQNKKLQSAVENVYSFLKMAHEESINRQIKMYVNYNTQGTNWCIGISDTGLCNCTITSQCTVNGAPLVFSGSLFPNISMSISGFSYLGGTQYNFNYDGTRGTVSAAGTVTLSTINSTVAIQVNIMGLVNVCSNNLSTYPSC